MIIFHPEASAKSYFFFCAPPLALDLHLPSWPEKCKVTDASTTSHLMPALQAT